MIECGAGMFLCSSGTLEPHVYSSADEAELPSRSVRAEGFTCGTREEKYFRHTVHSVHGRIPVRDERRLT